jgi:hypothetical protein
VGGFSCLLRSKLDVLSEAGYVSLRIAERIKYREDDRRAPSGKAILFPRAKM